MYDLQKVRADFPILAREVHGKPLVYLDNAATTQKPRQVIDALVDYYEGYNANVHRGVHALSQEATDRYEAARAKVARFIGAERPEEIIWTRNASESLNLVAHTWARDNIREGDEIVVTPYEHHSNLVPWQKVARDAGAKLRVLPMLESDQSLDMSRLDEFFTPRLKLLAAVHMSNGIGIVNPVEELARRARGVGATVLIDATQSVPHMPVNVRELDCDFLTPERPQDARTNRNRRAVRKTRDTGRHGAVHARRRDGLGSLVRPRHLERPADEVRGGNAQHRGRHRLGRGD